MAPFRSGPVPCSGPETTAPLKREGGGRGPSRRRRRSRSAPQAGDDVVPVAADELPGGGQAPPGDLEQFGLRGIGGQQAALERTGDGMQPGPGDGVADAGPAGDDCSLPRTLRRTGYPCCCRYPSVDRT